MDEIEEEIDGICLTFPDSVRIIKKDEFTIEFEFQHDEFLLHLILPKGYPDSMDPQYVLKPDWKMDSFRAKLDELISEMSGSFMCFEIVNYVMDLIKSDEYSPLTPVDVTPVDAQIFEEEERSMVSYEQLIEYVSPFKDSKYKFKLHRYLETNQFVRKKFSKQKFIFPIGCAICKDPENIWIFGGLDLKAKQVVNTLYRYDCTKEEFSQVNIHPHLPPAAFMASYFEYYSGTVFKNVTKKFTSSMIIYGGIDNSSQLTGSLYRLYFSESYAKSEVILETSGTDHAGRINCRLHRYRDNLIVVGGQYKDGTFPTNTSYGSNLPQFLIQKQPRCNYFFGMKVNSIDVPESRAGMSTEIIGDTLIMVGGYNATRIFDDTWKFDLETLQWRKVETLICPKICLGSNFFRYEKDSIFRYGGWNGKCWENSIQEFDTVSESWKFHVMLDSNLGHGDYQSCFFDGSRFILVGGAAYVKVGNNILDTISFLKESVLPKESYIISMEKSFLLNNTKLKTKWISDFRKIFLKMNRENTDVKFACKLPNGRERYLYAHGLFLEPYPMFKSELSGYHLKNETMKEVKFPERLKFLTFDAMQRLLVYIYINTIDLSNITRETLRDFYETAKYFEIFPVYQTLELKVSFAEFAQYNPTSSLIANMGNSLKPISLREYSLTRTENFSNQTAFFQILCRKDPEISFDSTSKRDNTLPEFEHLMYPGESIDDIYLFHCHKGVIAQRCSYFRSMFTSAFIESQSNQIRIDDLSLDSIETMLLYFYSGLLPSITAETCVELYVASHKLNFQELSPYLRKIIKEHACNDTILDLFYLSKILEDVNLRTFTAAYCRKHLEEILKSPEQRERYESLTYLDQVELKG